MHRKWQHGGKSMMNMTYVNWGYQDADSADDTTEGHKEWCVLCPSIRSSPPLSAPDRGDAGSRVFVTGHWREMCLCVILKLWVYVCVVRTVWVCTWHESKGWVAGLYAWFKWIEILPAVQDEKKKRLRRRFPWQSKKMHKVCTYSCTQLNGEWLG